MLWWRQLVILTAVICGTISTTNTGTADEGLLGQLDEPTTVIDDVDASTAFVTEVIDGDDKVTSTVSDSDLSYIDEQDVAITTPTYGEADAEIDITAKSTTGKTNFVKPTTSQVKQVVTPMKLSGVSANGTNTTLPDSLWLLPINNTKSVTAYSEHTTQNTTTHILQTLVNQRTVDNISSAVQTQNTETKLDESRLQNYNTTTTHVNHSHAVNNVTSERTRTNNGTTAVQSISTSLKDDATTRTPTIDASTVKAKNYSEESSSLFLLDSTSSTTSLPSTIGAESTTAYDDTREYTSPRPSLKVEDTLQASRIDKNLDRGLQRRKYINHAALWITIGFVVVLVSYIVVLVVYNRTRPDWQPSSQEYHRFEDEAPEVSSRTTGCTTDEDNISNHSTDAMTQTHPFLDTIGSYEDSREITGYYSDSEQLYRQ